MIVIRGLVKLKIFLKKFEKKLCSDQTYKPNHPLFNFYFFWNICKHENNTKKTKKQNYQKK